MRSFRKQALVLTVAAALLGGCGSGQTESTKAGGSAAPVTLRIGTDEGPGSASANEIEEFAREVEKRSNGSLRIEPVWHASGTEQKSWDQLVARQVVGGALTMGLIPTRAWDTEGVTSMRALNAPFLVTSDALVKQIVTDDMAVTMMGGLDKLGITGLALLPESMRHVFGFGKPLLAPADFAGATIRAPRSETVYALFTALGASSDDPNGPDFEEGANSGSIAAAESDFALASSLPVPATATGNLTLFPKVNSLVVNTAKFEKLTQDQQSMLRDAASATRTWALANLPDDTESAKAFCGKSGAIAVASDSNVAAFENAVQPVYTQLEADSTTKTLIGQIRELKKSTAAPAAVAPCGSPTSTATTEAPVVTVDASATAAFPNGVFRMEITADQMIADKAEPRWSHDVAGVWTITFDHENLTIVDVNGGSGRRSEDNGRYCVAGGRVMIDIFGDKAVCGDGVLFSAGWTLKDGTLHFSDVENGQPGDQDLSVLFGTQTWTKIG